MKQKFNDGSTINRRKRIAARDNLKAVKGGYENYEQNKFGQYKYSGSGEWKPTQKDIQNARKATKKVLKKYSAVQKKSSTTKKKGK